MGISTLQHMVKAACVGLVLACGLSVSSVLAQDLEIVVGETIIDENGQEQIVLMSSGEFFAAAAQPHFIEFQPSVTSSMLGAAVNMAFTGFGCVDIVSRQLILFCDITIEFGNVLDDGGHVHNDPAQPRPLGNFDPMFGNSGSNGILFSTYTAEEVSGIWEFTVTGVGPAGQSVFPFTSTIFIRIPGLQELLPGTNYRLTGSLPEHPVNHYGTPQYDLDLVTIANQYAVAFAGEPLDYNNMSLKFGGLFDICAVGNPNCIPPNVPIPWVPPHKSHRFGVDVDTPILSTAARQAALRQAIGNVGFSLIFVEGTHWHLRQ